MRTRVEMGYIQQKQLVEQLFVLLQQRIRDDNVQWIVQIHADLNHVPAAFVSGRSPLLHAQRLHELLRRRHIGRENVENGLLEETLHFDKVNRRRRKRQILVKEVVEVDGEIASQHEEELIQLNDSLRYVELFASQHA